MGPELEDAQGEENNEVNIEELVVAEVHTDPVETAYCYSLSDGIKFNEFEGLNEHH